MRAETIAALTRHLSAAGAAASTISTYARIARVFIDSLGDERVEATTNENIARFLSRPRSRGAQTAPATRNLEIVALRALFRALPASADPMAGFELRRTARRDPAVPSVSELRAVFEAAAAGDFAARDLAILALGFQAGLRVHEIVGLDLEQIDLDGRVLLALRGKGGTRHDQPLGEEVAALLGGWTAQRGQDPGPLFPGARDRALSVRTVQRRVAALRVAAGIVKQITPHSLRHATATMAIARGVDLPTTAALMRHARVETTMLYVGLASEARRDAANRLGSAIPRSVLPPKTQDLPANGGVPNAVDAEDGLRDAA